MGDDTWSHIFDNSKGSDVNKNKIEQDYKSCVKEKTELITRIEELNKVITVTKKEIDELITNKEKIDLGHENCIKEKRELMAQIEELKKIIAMKQKEIDDPTKNKEKIDQDNKNYIKEKEELTDKIEKLDNDLSDCKKNNIKLMNTILSLTEELNNCRNEFWH